MFLTTYEDGRANQSISDQDVLARASALGRTVLTLDRVDFKRLHRAHPEHWGMVICTVDPAPYWTSPKDLCGSAKGQRASSQLAGNCNKYPWLLKSSLLHH
ncbi:MAG: DUF5615 family PIN-like protein [Blastocatellia bacterium]